MEQNNKPVSPKWGRATKVIVAVVMLVLTGAVVIRFENIFPPLIMALIIAYLFYPVASFLERRARMPWGLSVTLIYIVLGLITGGLLVLGGFEIVVQVQSFISVIQTTLYRLPELIDNFTLQSITIGPFTYTLSSLGLDLSGLSNQLINTIELLLGQTGNIIGSMASSAISTIGWLLFLLFVSYFLLIESGGLRERIISYDFRDYNEDARRFGERLGNIWNAFLRGQLILFFMAIFIYTLVLNIFGVRYAFGLALVAGLARFLPYIGPAINWILLGLIAFFQDYKLFGMSPLAYTALVIIVAIVIDYMLDYMVTPRIMSQTLKVHSAAILVAVIVAADLLGLLGVVIAAPILATVQLALTYTVRKLNDEDPWPPEEKAETYSLRRQFKDWLAKIRPPRKKPAA
jgi:predicted PurR-regulated permease PerM